TRLASVQGRVADTMRDARGNGVCGIFFSRIFSWSQPLAKNVRHWQAIQHVDRSVTIKVEPVGPINDDTTSDIRRNFEHYLPGIPVRVELVSEIPLGKNGKRQTVLVERA